MELGLFRIQVYCNCNIEKDGTFPMGVNTYASSPLSSDFALYETYPFQSLSVEPYEFNDDLYVVFAQPSTGMCTVFIWDHVNMLFRSHYNITCKSQFFIRFRHAGGK